MLRADPGQQPLFDLDALRFEHLIPSYRVKLLCQRREKTSPLETVRLMRSQIGNLVDEFDVSCPPIPPALLKPDFTVIISAFERALRKQILRWQCFQALGDPNAACGAGVDYGLTKPVTLFLAEELQVVEQQHAF